MSQKHAVRVVHAEQCKYPEPSDGRLRSAGRKINYLRMVRRIVERDCQYLVLVSCMLCQEVLFGPSVVLPGPFRTEIVMKVILHKDIIAADE